MKFYQDNWKKQKIHSLLILKYQPYFQNLLPLGLRRVVECSSTRTVDNHLGTISRTRIFGRKKIKKLKNLSRTTLTRAWVSGGR